MKFLFVIYLITIVYNDNKKNMINYSHKSNISTKSKLLQNCIYNKRNMLGNK